MSSKLYLIPTMVSDQETLTTLPTSVGEIVKTLRCFMVEERSTAERFIKKINPARSFEDVVFFELNEHTPLKEAEQFFQEYKDNDIGIISESGLPCVADPGAHVVFLAHKNNVEIIPLTGPSSIFLALMASGLNGQNFAFNGYLPKDREERRKKIKLLENRSLTEGQTQIFMEAPHHNQKTFEDILSFCDSQTLLSVAVDLTSSKQQVKTLPIKEWQKTNINLHKRPALFLLQKRLK